MGVVQKKVQPRPTAGPASSEPCLVNPKSERPPAPSQARHPQVKPTDHQAPQRPDIHAVAGAKRAHAASHLVPYHAGAHQEQDNPHGPSPEALQMISEPLEKYRRRLGTNQPKPRVLPSVPRNPAGATSPSAAPKRTAKRPQRTVHARG